MVLRRQRNLKLFTVALSFFAISITTFFMNYTQNSGSTVLSKFSEHFRRFMMNSKRPCGCETCVADPEISSWFDERFNISISPLLTKQNNVIPESVYKWWLTLQGETNPKDIYQVIEKLFEVIPGDLDFMDHSPYRCRSCAVVGNSGNLKNSHYGPEIDSHDLVLRTYGGKTTHHFVYPESVRDLQDNVTMILIPFKTLDLQWIVTRPHSWDHQSILIYSPELMKYVYDKWLFNHGRYPSTGILSVIFALHVCDKVDLYGFGADSKGNWHHYWENNPSAGAFRQTGVHDGDFEANILANLTSINKVLMFSHR
ncbi:hypothetical protein GDO86_010688 [Hymenochirus boettgeri]|uniref:CMP-N-acetylneuraminate-beta-galactosamide-alpha-2,3-sialyltransferase 1 n=1 Tax=Hymenochirus boettgeri TaxID=247094 RepID=A0A8T2JGK4_9PIPI|nr:hypothetical protein GDO86_010688 [Hymenochirus boettgeri]